MLDRTAGQVGQGPALLLQALGLAQQELESKRNHMLNRDVSGAQFILGGMQGYNQLKQREEDTAFRQSQADYGKTQDDRTYGLQDRDLKTREAISNVQVALANNDLEGAKLALAAMPGALDRKARGEEASIRGTEANTMATYGANERANDMHAPQFRGAMSDVRVAEDTEQPRTDLLYEQARQAGYRSRIDASGARRAEGAERAGIEADNLQVPYLQSQIRGNDAQANYYNQRPAAGGGGAGDGSKSMVTFIATERNRINQSYSQALAAQPNMLESGMTKDQYNQKTANLELQRKDEEEVLDEFEKHGRDLTELEAAGISSFIVYRLFRASKLLGDLEPPFDWKDPFGMGAAGANGTRAPSDGTAGMFDEIDAEAVPPPAGGIPR